ncbi:hypothetical protein C4580_05725 [Candidatus Woesearchaeota archaeon]|nr:MAG: hypothetical protein C4580_05725 [Candidatus Woesearchaeota archaeon]
MKRAYSLGIISVIASIGCTATPEQPAQEPREDVAALTSRISALETQRPPSTRALAQETYERLTGDLELRAELYQLRIDLARERRETTQALDALRQDLAATRATIDEYRAQSAGRDETAERTLSDLSLRLRSLETSVRSLYDARRAAEEDLRGLRPANR